jgi:tetratricopeptide (TPR) repeat protein
VEVGQFLWERDYEKAASKLEKTLDDVFAISQKSGAWHALWLGYCYELLGSLDRAQHYYTRARGASLNIPPCDRNDLLVTNDEVSPQIKEVVRYLSDALTTKKDILNRFDYETLHLDGTGTSAQHEEAIRSLGQYLGLNSTRPEKEYGTGPDVLWDCEGGPALCMEVKTKKTKSETYTKAKDIGQMHDHLMWCKNNKIMQPIPCFVGPSIPASPEANPPENTIVINLEELNKLSKRLRSALADILAVSTYPELVSITKKIFTERNLLWPDLLQGMKTEKLVDIGKQR